MIWVDQITEVLVNPWMCGLQLEIMVWKALGKMDDMVFLLVVLSNQKSEIFCKQLLLVHRLYLKSRTANSNMWEAYCKLWAISVPVRHVFCDISWLILVLSQCINDFICYVERGLVVLWMYLLVPQNECRLTLSAEQPSRCNGGQNMSRH